MKKTFFAAPSQFWENASGTRQCVSNKNHSFPLSGEHSRMMLFFFQFKIAEMSLVIYYRKELAGKEGVSDEQYIGEQFLMHL